MRMPKRGREQLGSATICIESASSVVDSEASEVQQSSDR